MGDEEKQERQRVILDAGKVNQLSKESLDILTSEGDEADDD